MLAVVAADQLSKSIVLATVSGNGTGGLFSPRLVRNTGASSGIGSHFPLLVTITAVAATVVVAVMLWRNRGVRAGWAWAVVLGGALGNLTDRFVRSPGLGRGAVIDWLHLGSRPATFNLADVCVQLGAVVAITLMWWDGRSRARHQSPSEARPAAG